MTSHVLKRSDLRPGDVLLCIEREPSRSTQKIQRRIGLYTHAAIVVGRGRVADATGVGISSASLKDLVEWSQRIFVLRGWGLWTPAAVKQLKRFVRWAVAQKGSFNFKGMRRAIAAREEHLGNIMDRLRDENTPAPTHRKSRYFCSEFVVACFADSGLIGDRARIVFKPDTYTPRMLIDDRLFGAPGGYIVRKGTSVPQDDPLLDLFH